MKTTTVGIVIATYRRPEMVRDTIRSLRDMTLPEGVGLEVLVIDNDPDGTARLATEEVAVELGEIFTVRYIHEKEKGLSRARNRGIEESHGEIIAFLDDDVYVCTDWLVAILHCFERTGAAAVGGRTLAHWETEPEPVVRATQRETVDIDIGEHDVQLHGRAVPGGGNAAFRRSVFASGLRFSTDLGRIGKVLLSGEDTELFQRLRLEGQTLWHCAGAVIAHRVAGHRMTPAYLVERAYWFGISYAIIDRKLRGKLYQVTCAACRAAKALLIDLPCWGAAFVSGNLASGLVARCSMAKQCGYLRGTLALAGLLSRAMTAEQQSPPLSVGSCRENERPRPPFPIES